MAALILGAQYAARRLRVVCSYRSQFSTSTIPTPPATPKSFGREFEIPQRSYDKFHLEIDNQHANDHKLTFDEEPHIYSYEGKPLNLSVTGLVDSYFEKFDPKSAVVKMMSGSNWPRDGYVHKDGSSFTESEVLQQWEDIGLQARNRGTWMHYNIERYLNKLAPNEESPEIAQFLAFHKDRMVGRNIEPFRTEWRIVAPDLDLAGSVDFVGRNTKDGSYCIMDWKRAKGLEFSKSWGRKGRPPIAHVDSDDRQKYSLQLNIYKYILEQYYNVPISSMTVATFHPTLSSYYVIEVENMDKDVRAIMEDRKMKLLMK